MLACHKGTLTASAIEADISIPRGTKNTNRRRRESLERESEEKRKLHARKQDLHAKVKMTRDLALSWRFNKFMSEIEHE